MKTTHFMLSSGLPEVADVGCSLVTDKRKNAQGVWVRRFTLSADALLYFRDVETGQDTHYHRRIQSKPLLGHLDSMFRIGMELAKEVEGDLHQVGSWSAILVHSCVVGLCNRTTFHFFPGFRVFEYSECGYPILDWNSPHFEEFQLSTGHELRGWNTEAGPCFESHLPITLQEKGVLMRHIYGEALDMTRNNQVPIVAFESRGCSNRGSLFFVDNANQMKCSPIQAVRRLHYLAMMPEAGE